MPFFAFSLPTHMHSKTKSRLLQSILSDHDVDVDSDCEDSSSVESFYGKEMDKCYDI